MKSLIFGAAFIAASGCSWNPIAEAADGGPAELELSTFVNGHREVAAQHLFDWGLQADAIDALDGEYSFSFSFTPELSNAITAGGVAVHFSLWTSDGEFVLGIPKLSNDDMSFWMMDGYALRAMLEIKSGYRDLEKGVGYYAVLEPRDHLREQ